MENPKCKCGRNTLKDITKKTIVKDGDICTYLFVGEVEKQIYSCSGCLKDMNYCNCDDPKEVPF